MKKNILMVFGVGDSFCSKDSSRFLKVGEKILNDVQNLVHSNKKDYFGFVNVLEYTDKNEKIDPFFKAQRSKVLDITLFNPSTFSKENFLSIRSNINNKEQIFQSSDYLSFLLPPKEYNIFICGIDINGGFKDTINHLITEGYYITVYSDIIKPFSKETIEFLIAKSKDKANHLRFGKS